MELTPQMYQRLRDAQLRKIHSNARFFVKQYFGYLKSVKPEEIIDAIETGQTIKDYYGKMGIHPLRFALATARGFLKTSPRSKAQLKEAVTVDLVLTTLKYENPDVYTIIKRYGKKGKQHIQKDINDALKLLGVD